MKITPLPLSQTQRQPRWGNSPRSFPDPFVYLLLAAIVVLAVSQARSGAPVPVIPISVVALALIWGVRRLRQLPKSGSGHTSSAVVVIDLPTDHAAPHITGLFDNLDEQAGSEVIGVNSAVVYGAPCLSLMLNSDQEVCGARQIGYVPHIAIRDWESGAVTERALAVLKPTPQEAIRSAHDFISLHA